MIYQETLIGPHKPINIVCTLLNTSKMEEVLQLGDKNPNKPPKKKQKKKKKAVEDPPVKKKRKKKAA